MYISCLSWNLILGDGTDLQEGATSSNRRSDACAECLFVGPMPLQHEELFLS